MPVNPHSLCAVMHAILSEGERPIGIPMLRKRSGNCTAARDNPRTSGQVAALPTMAASAPLASSSAMYSSALMNRGSETCPQASMILGQPFWAAATPARDAAEREVSTNCRLVKSSAIIPSLSAHRYCHTGLADGAGPRANEAA